MPATDHPNDGHPSDEGPNDGNPSHDRPKENDAEGNSEHNDRSAAGPERDGTHALRDDEAHRDPVNDPLPLTRRERFANLRFNRTLGSVLDLLERTGFAFFIAAWTLLAVYDQLDAPLTSEIVLAVSGPVVMVIAVVLRVWLWGRFERPEE